MRINNNFFKKTGFFLEEITRSEIILQVLLVGLISGLLVVLFKICITGLFDFIQAFIKSMPMGSRLLIFPLITTIGGLISGLLVFKIAPETRGSGIPYVKMTLARLGRGTRLRSIFVKFFAGLAGMGAGLSLGREGPSVQLGAGSGALIAKLFRMRNTDKDKLIAAGSGAAIGATFNAPIAGTIFVLEELISSFTASLLFPVLVATVVASTVARHLAGSHHSLIIPKIMSSITTEYLPVFIILGILAGVLGIIFSKLIFLNIELFNKLDKIPQWAKPAMAGFLVGVVGIFLPYVIGSGNIGIDSLFQNKLSITIICVIFLCKLFITPFCFASGAAGGIFFPMLMLGSFLGYFVGFMFNFIGLHVDPIVISLVGMGAFLSAVARTPITAVVMVFEMTGDYNHILPIIFSAAIADLVAEKLNHKPIYSTLILTTSNKSKRAKILSKTKVKEVMVNSLQLLTPKVPLKKALEVMNVSNNTILPVISDNRKLLGLVNKTDIEDSYLYENASDLIIGNIMNPYPVTINAEDDLYMASYALHFNNIDYIVVIDKHRKVEGVLRRCDINIVFPNLDNQCVSNPQEDVKLTI